MADGFTDEVARLIADKLERLESVPAQFYSSMVEIQKSNLSRILGLIDKLDTKDGLIAVTDANLLKVEAITDAIREVLTGPEYEGAVKSLLDEMTAQAGITYRYFDATVDSFQVPKIAEAILREKKRVTVEQLLNMTDERLSVPMRTTISNAVVGGSSRQGLIDAVRLLTVGDADVDGRLLSGTRQIVSDAFALSDAAVTNTVADQLGLEWYLYTGGLIDTTRPFCKARVGNFYHRSEVEAWPVTAGDWAGRMAGTTPQTIFVTRGGYNCQHALLPVSEFAVPPETRSRIK